MPDKYKAVWLSYSSLNDFLACPRLYYLKNVFKNPNTNHKISIASPYLTLGTTIHKVIEALKNIKTENRGGEIQANLLENFKKEWQKYPLHKGGFKSETEEEDFFTRGENMLKKLVANPRELLNKIIPIKYFYDGNLVPNYYLSEEENLILCGNLDWLEYLEKTEALRIIDFKTGRNDEQPDSLQLPIYYLIITNLQKEKTKKYTIAEIAYWYLDFANKKESSQHQEFQIIKIDEEKLAQIEKARVEIIELGKKIKAFRESGNYQCPNEKVTGEGCTHCREFELVYKYILDKEVSKFEPTMSLDFNKANKVEELEKVEYVGVSDYNQDTYFIK